MEDVKINPEKSSTAKVIEHIPGSYSISMKLLFKWKKNNRNEKKTDIQ